MSFVNREGRSESGFELILSLECAHHALNYFVKNSFFSLASSNKVNKELFRQSSFYLGNIRFIYPAST